jgi:hypothetical protein
MVATAIPAPAAALIPFAASGIVSAIKATYQVTGDLGGWLDRHVDELQKSKTPSIASTGDVLAAAKQGFMLGYVASTVIVAAGHCLLGNPLSALATLGSSVVLLNPVAMTCAAVGAIYFGWSALGEKQRAEHLKSLSTGLSLGVELIRAILDFSVRMSRDLMDSNQLESIKKLVKEQAEAFGRTLYDITGQISDLAAEGAEAISRRIGSVAKAAKDAAGKLGDVVVAGASSATETIKALGTREGPKKTRRVKVADKSKKTPSQRPSARRRKARSHARQGRRP